MSFWDKVDIGLPHDCWEWKASLSTPGYGQIIVEGKNRSAHKLAYELKHGAVPDGFVVMHSCHNRRCCNPNHLSAGTVAQNVRDGGSSKLTYEQVAMIRMISHLGTKRLGEMFNMHKESVRRILRGERWGVAA